MSKITIEIDFDSNKSFNQLYEELCEIYNESYRTEEFWFKILTQYIEKCTNLRYRYVLLRKLAKPDIIEWYNQYVKITKEFVEESELLKILYNEFAMTEKVEPFIERNRYRYEHIFEPEFECKLFRILYRNLHDISDYTFNKMTSVLITFGQPLNERNLDVLLTVM